MGYVHFTRVRCTRGNNVILTVYYIVGLVPTLTQIAPYVALQFGIYTTSVAVWKKLSGVSCAH